MCWVLIALQLFFQNNLHTKVVHLGAACRDPYSTYMDTLSLSLSWFLSSLFHSLSLSVHNFNGFEEGAEVVVRVQSTVFNCGCYPFFNLDFPALVPISLQHVFSN